MDCPKPNSDASELVYTLLQVFLQMLEEKVGIIIFNSQSPTSEKMLEAKYTIKGICQCFERMAKKTDIIFPEPDRENFISEIDSMLKKIPAELPTSFREGLQNLLTFLRHQAKL